GTTREEFRVAAVKDRVDTTLQVWMGLTMGCAKCHNHKFDPISQKEYYQFFALFNQTADADRPDESPVIPAPSPAILEEQRKLDERIAALKKELGGPSPQLDAEQARWEESLRTSGQWLALDPVEARSEGGATLKKQSDLSLRAEGPNPANDTYTITTQVD